MLLNCKKLQIEASHMHSISEESASKWFRNVYKIVFFTQIILVKLKHFEDYQYFEKH